MRHRRIGRRLGRSASHRRAMFRNLASALFLTVRSAEGDDNAPKVKGRIVTTLSKAKEVRPIVERCITLAKRALAKGDAAKMFNTTAKRGSEEWKSWRRSDRWQQWNKAIAPVVAARRAALRVLGDKEAVRLLFDDIAPRFSDRPGGYTRILKLATPRLGDAGPRAILELVGERDRVTTRSERPAFDSPAAEAASGEPESTGAAATEPAAG